MPSSEGFDSDEMTSTASCCSARVVWTLPTRVRVSPLGLELVVPVVIDNEVALVVVPPVVIVHSREPSEFDIL